MTLCLTLYVPLHAQVEVQAHFTDQPPKVDGRVDDEVWRNATVIDQLFQREPETGKPATERTEIFMCYDAEDVYFGFRCYDDPRWDNRQRNGA